MRIAQKEAEQVRLCSPLLGEIYRRQQGGAAAVKSRMNLGSISFPERPGACCSGRGRRGDGELVVLILINYRISLFYMSKQEVGLSYSKIIE